MHHHSARAAGLGVEIERARLRRGLSRRGLSAQAGLARATLVNLENGTGSLTALATALRALDYRFYEQPDELELGQWVKERRQASRLSQERFCAIAGISKPALIRVEAGGGNILSLVRALSATGATMTLVPSKRSPPVPLRKVSAISPLRYPGGKSRALPFLSQYMPSYIEEYREPFAGGAAMAFFVGQKHPDAKIWINDAYTPLVAFWRTLQNPEATQRLVGELLHLRRQCADDRAAKALFSQLRAVIGQPRVDEATMAVAFYVLNRCSFSGLGARSSYSAQSAEQRWTVQHIRKLETLTQLIMHWKVTNLDYTTVMREPWTSTHAFSFIDPPYEIVGERLYGAQDSSYSFKHAKFREELRDCKSRTMLTYNYHSDDGRFFGNWQSIGWDLRYSIQSNVIYKMTKKRRQEMLLLNYAPT